MSTKDTTYGGRAPDSSGSRTLFQELFSTAAYKRTQGRMVRQLTCLAIWLTAAAVGWRVYKLYLERLVERTLGEQWYLAGYLLAAAIIGLGIWIGYRLVNWPRFADFLISVEADLNKVSWPSQKELTKASMVVIFTILFMSILLFGYDAFWRILFDLLGIN
jgi:preprotein translocase subunit SecE